MAQGYRNLQRWNQWLSQHFLGNQLLEAEEKKLSPLLDKHFGKHASLVGVPKQYTLLSATKIPCHSLITPLFANEHKHDYIESDLHDLPILTGSVDIVVLPHTLEFIDNPRQLLTEACRIIKPQGLIVILGFNPLSSWGLKKIIEWKNKTGPWQGNFINHHKIIHWLRLVDFVIEKQSSILYTPRLNLINFDRKLSFMEKISSKCFPILGGVYIIVARAKVIPLTPIRLKWKQKLGGIRISPTIPGSIARQLK